MNAMTESASADQSGIVWGKRRTGMLIRATVAQNVGTGCAFGGLGLSVLALQQRYDASLGAAAIGLSITVLSMMALGPLIAGLIARCGLRFVMSAGVLTSAIGYVALAYAPSLPLALTACALLIGPGGAMFAVMPPAVLASGWCREARGRAMGFVYLPIVAMLLPLFGVTIIQHYGLASFYLSLAAAHLLLFPLMLGVIEAPTEAPHQQDSSGDKASTSATRRIIQSRIFWLMALSNGVLSGTAIVGAAHMLPIFTEYGQTMQAGATLLTFANIASILGTLLAGYACDRIGSARTLGVIALAWALAWALIAVTGWLPILATSAILIGICNAAVFPPVSTLSVQVFGMGALPRVLGLLSIFTLPFTFLMPPVVGHFHDIFDSYRPVFIALIVACLVPATAYIWISWHLSRPRRSSPVNSGAALLPSSSA